MFMQVRYTLFVWIPPALTPTERLWLGGEIARVGPAASPAARSAIRASNASASTTSETSPHASASAAVKRRLDVIHSNARGVPSRRWRK